MVKIKDIKSDSNNISILVRIEKKIKNSTNSGSSYLSLSVIDKFKNKIEARLWNAEAKDDEDLKINSFVILTGNGTIFKNILQFKVNKYKIISSEELNKNNHSEDDFYAIAPIDCDNEYDFIINLISKFENDTYKKIGLDILKTNEKLFKLYPAAVSIHHNVIHGLLWHSVSLLRNAIALRNVYDYAEIDWELVYIGTILHDIGKVIEMDGKNASEYTLAGKLIGHISIGNAFIKKSSEKLNLDVNENNILNEDVIKLQHVILASHGRYEFGSPVLPQLIEAVIVSSLDDLDARIYRINDELKKINFNSESNFTQKIFTEDNKMFLKHKK